MKLTHVNDTVDRYCYIFYGYNIFFVIEENLLYKLFMFVKTFYVCFIWVKLL
jgi:hypothetical protein